MNDQGNIPPAGSSPHDRHLSVVDGGGDEPPARRPKVYKVRVLLILLGLSVIAFISTVFGMMMAVASDLPALENRQEFKSAKNSFLYDVNGKPLGVLTGDQNRILVTADQISPAMTQAIISIEDKRFYDHDGIDFPGIGRALVQDVLKRNAAQGASTIPQQFVKNALAAQAKRTVFEKLREAALAYHLSRKWTKRKILTEYLNSIYFGNGAYGIESAARVYFSYRHPGCDTDPQNPCASQLTPAESAMIAGIVASPSAWDPITNPRDAMARRNLVLANMRGQGYLTDAAYRAAKQETLPDATQIRPPREESEAPYFTTWIKAQIVDRFGANRAFEGGLKIHTTIDLDLQRAAEQAINNQLPAGSGPSAAMVVIDNRTGEVRAMVGGRDYNRTPFNLATQGQRQPGSAFKPFVLATALKKGIGQYSTWESKRKVFAIPDTQPQEYFPVNNFEGSYSGVQTLEGATTYSDNSVFAEVGIKVGTKNIARTAHALGIRTPISTNYAMTLGGLKQGVTPLDMAHAFQSIADGGRRAWGTLGAQDRGPNGITEVKTGPGPGTTVVRHNDLRFTRVLPKDLAETEKQILATVVTSGTGTAAQTGQFAAGKTGTTENYGDAWFVGFDDTYTAAVWVGYPDSLKPMLTEFGGEPVKGGSFPAEIWRDFMVNAEEILAQRKNEREQKKADAAAARGEEYTPQFDTGTTTSDGSDTSGDSSGGDTSGTDTTGGGDTSGTTGGGDTSDGDTGGGATDGGDTSGGDTGGGTTGGDGGDTGGGATGGDGGDTGGGGGSESGGIAPPSG